MAERSRRRIFFNICMMLVAGLLMAGCGVKAFPVSPRQIPPPAITDLKAEIKGNLAELSWSIARPAEEKAAPVGFRVYRSKKPVSQADCKNCPITFQQSADLSVTSEKLEAGRMTYTETLEKGYRYLYKVVGYGEGGVAGKDSNTVRVVY